VFSTSIRRIRSGQARELARNALELGSIAEIEVLLSDRVTPPSVTGVRSMK